MVKTQNLSISYVTQMASEWLYSDANRLDVHDVCKWIHSNDRAHKHLILRKWGDGEGYEYRDTPPNPDQPIYFENFIFEFDHHSPSYFVREFSDLKDAERFICDDTGVLSSFTGFIVVFWKRRVLPYQITYLDAVGEPQNITLRQIATGIGEKKMNIIRNGKLRLEWSPA